LRLPQAEAKTTGQQQRQRNAKTLALPAPQQRLQRGVIITAQATRAVLVALFFFCSYVLWGHAVFSLPAADLGVMATSVTAVNIVGAIVPQAETKMAGR
jgi:hypothetical protein